VWPRGQATLNFASQCFADIRRCQMPDVNGLNIGCHLDKSSQRARPSPANVLEGIKTESSKPGNQTMVSPIRWYQPLKYWIKLCKPMKVINAGGRASMLDIGLISINVYGAISMGQFLRINI
jgi:hypothetical protein